MDKKVNAVAPEEQVQEQAMGKCIYCNKINALPHLTKIKPKFCMQCGRKIDYSLSKKPALLKLVSDPQ